MGAMLDLVREQLTAHRAANFTPPTALVVTTEQRSALLRDERVFDTMRYSTLAPGDSLLGMRLVVLAPGESTEWLACFLDIRGVGVPEPLDWLEQAMLDAITAACSVAGLKTTRLGRAEAARAAAKLMRERVEKAVG